MNIVKRHIEELARHYGKTYEQVSELGQLEAIKFMRPLPKWVGKDEVWTVGVLIDVTG